MSFSVLSAAPLSPRRCAPESNRSSEEAGGGSAVVAHRCQDADEVLHAEEVGVLEAEGEMEATYRFKQNEIKAAVDMLTARKIFDLSLEYGPSRMRYSRNGRHLLLGGQTAADALKIGSAMLGGTRELCVLFSKGVLQAGCT